ncbi:MAG: ribosome recycling factor [Spirochaetia bacterium]
MQKALDSLKDVFNQIRSGKASPALFDRICVDYYGTQTPINQVANISTPEARAILIQPWDKESLPLIEKAIMTSNLSLNPSNDGKVIRILMPPLTEERRKDLVKQAKTETEKHRVSLRNLRRDILEEVKKDGATEDEEKMFSSEIQKITDIYMKKIESLLEEKEKEIMEI